MSATATAPPPLVVPGPDRSLLDRLDAVAEADPGATALVDGHRHLDFGGLVDTTRAVAAHLDDALGPDRDPLPVLVDQRLDGIVTVLAVLRTGRAVVVLDPHLPDRRIAEIVTRLGTRRVVVDHPAHRARVDEVAALLGARLDAVVARPTDPSDASPRPLADLVVDDPAFVVFTSGSTGEPKGVVHSHGLFLNESYGAAVVLDLGPDDHVLLGLPMGFGAGMTVVLMALLNGSTLHVTDPRRDGLAAFVEVLRRDPITTVHLTPSLLRAVLDEVDGPEPLASLRLLTTCGEAVHGSDVRRLRPLLPPTATYTNWSGSSEVGHLAFNPIRPGDAVPDGVIPVGHAAPNREVLLLGEDGAPVAMGETGEIVVRSRYLANGYWKRPDLTGERFHGALGEERTYRSGDLGHVAGDGKLVLAGRLDAAVKVRGYLVAPAEVESALVALDDVADAVVVARDGGDGGLRLVAHVVPDRGAVGLSAATLRRSLREVVPEWMVPSAFALHTTLPRNERGKVDRLALPDVAGAGPTGPAAPGIETELAAVWQDVLGVEVGADDDFMELGGDSLLATEMLLVVEQRTGVSLRAADLVAAPTVRELARRVRGAPAGSELPAHPTAVAVRPGGTATPIFCFAGAGQSGFSLLPFARRLDDHHPVHAFHAHGLEQRGLADWTVAANARRHLEVLRLIQPTGPYVLVGYSFGGLVALEVARRLREAGAEVALLAVVDTYLPGTIEDELRRADASGATTDEAPTPPDGGRHGRRDRWRDKVRNRARSLFPEGPKSLADLAMAARVLTAGLVRHAPETLRDVFYYQTRLVSLRYRPPVHQGPAVVVLADGNHGNADAWRQVVPDTLEVRMVACDHRSLLAEPFVSEVAALVDRHLPGGGQTGR